MTGELRLDQHNRSTLHWHAHRNAGDQFHNNYYDTMLFNLHKCPESWGLLAKSGRAGGNLKSKVNSEDLLLNWVTWSICIGCSIGWSIAFFFCEYPTRPQIVEAQ